MIDIYRQNPLLINKNAIEIYKKVKYCIQNNIPYKKEDGTYESFLFSEAEWQKVFNKESVMVTEAPSTKPLEESFVTVEPVVAEVSAPEITPVVDVELEEAEPAHIDIKEYMKATNDVAELEAKTTNFAAIRQELEGQLAELDALKSASFDDLEISFNDLEPESYGMGRAA